MCVFVCVCVGLGGGGYVGIHLLVILMIQPPDVSTHRPDQSVLSVSLIPVWPPQSTLYWGVPIMDFLARGSSTEDQNQDKSALVINNAG